MPPRCNSDKTHCYQWDPSVIASVDAITFAHVKGYDGCILYIVRYLPFSSAEAEQLM